LQAICKQNVQSIAPVAQLDRALDYGSKGLGFESLRVHKKALNIKAFFMLEFVSTFLLKLSLFFADNLSMVLFVLNTNSTDEIGQRCGHYFTPKQGSYLKKLAFLR
jgi:hypothetical protein